MVAAVLHWNGGRNDNNDDNGELLDYICEKTMQAMGDTVE